MFGVGLWLTRCMSNKDTNPTLDLREAWADGATSYEDAPWRIAGRLITPNADEPPEPSRERKPKITPFALLTKEQRHYLRNSTAPIVELALEFGVTSGTMSAWLIRLGGVPRSRGASSKDQ